MPSDRLNIFFSNVIGIRFGDNDVFLTFGVQTDRRGDSDMDDSTIIAITPRTAKILAHSLNLTIEHFESVFGPIPLPEGKLDAIRDALVVGPEHQARKNEAGPSSGDKE